MKIMTNQQRNGLSALCEGKFQLEANESSVKKEVIAGITTFLTMLYILAVNPSILAAAGMNSGSVFVATALASATGSILMGVLANYPFALAPGMGLNAYFAYTVCGAMGYSWQVALSAVLVEGILFVILSVTNIRTEIFNAIPQTLKYGVSAGIGMFIAFIGMQNMRLCVPDTSTCVTRYDFTQNFHSVGITVIIACLGIIITVFLLIMNVRAGIFLGIISTWLLAVIAEITGLYIPDPELGTYSVIPSGIIGTVPSMSTFMQFAKVSYKDIDLKSLLNFVTIMFAFLFVDMFDTIGTLIGVATQANMLTEDGKLPRIKGALLADAIATIIGAIFGTSTTTTFAESAAGVSEGGRTGLTAITTGICFIVALVFYPLFSAIPSFATAPALIVVGCIMMSSLVKIKFENYNTAIPAYIAFLSMAALYSISEGISMGIISYTVLNTMYNIAIDIKKGDANKVTIHPLMYVLSLLFIIRYVVLG